MTSGVSTARVVASIEALDSEFDNAVG